MDYGDWDSWRCGCGRLMSDENGTCGHCDRPCPHPEDGQCTPCRTILRAMEDDKREFGRRPHPTPDDLHERTAAQRADVPAGPDGNPIGAVGRCQRCGGRTYVTDTGPWCPRAFCTTGTPVDATQKA